MVSPVVNVLTIQPEGCCWAGVSGFQPSLLVEGWKVHVTVHVWVSHEPFLAVGFRLPVFSTIEMLSVSDSQRPGIPGVARFSKFSQSSL